VNPINNFIMSLNIKEKYNDIYKLILEYDLNILLKPNNSNIEFVIEYDGYQIEIKQGITEKEFQKKIIKFLRKIKMKRLKSE